MNENTYGQISQCIILLLGCSARAACTVAFHSIFVSSLFAFHRWLNLFKKLLIGLDRIIPLNLWRKATWGLVKFSALFWLLIHWEYHHALTLSTLLVEYPDTLHTTTCFSNLSVCFSCPPLSVVISASVTLLWADWTWCHCAGYVCMKCGVETGKSNKLPPIAINAQSPESIFLLSFPHSPPPQCICHLFFLHDSTHD